MLRRRSVALGSAGVVLAAGLAVTTLAVGADDGSDRPVVPITQAPDPAAAMVAARRQKSPVTVADLTTETRQVRAQPSGAFEAELSTVPVRVRRGDGWAPVDTALEYRADGTVAPRTVGVDLAFSAGGTGPLVRYGVRGSTVTLSWPGPLPKPALEGDTATYPEVWPGVDLVMRAGGQGYTQHVVVKNARAALLPEVREIRLAVRTDGLSLVADGDGGFEGRDATGTPVFASPPSRMWDSAPSPKEAVVAVGVSAAALVLRPAASLLDDPATTFPVVIDPAPAEINKNIWGGMYSGNPNQKYDNGTADPGGTAQVGRCNWANCDSVTGIARTYFTFDTRWLAGKNWISSTLNTYAVHRPDCSARNQNLYWVNGVFGAGTTWNSHAGSGHWVINTQAVKGTRAGCAEPGEQPVGFTTNGHVTFGNFSTYFLGASDENDRLAWRKYDPARTRLVVQYNTTPNPPTEPTVLPSPPPGCFHCGTKVWLGDDFITMRARLSDPDGDQVKPWWTVTANPGGGGSYHGGVVNSGDLATNVLDARGRADGTEYSWSVAAEDGSHRGAATAGPSYVLDRTPVTARPTVGSDLYPEDNAWHGGSGVAGTFTFGANGVGDIDRYRYGWDTALGQTVKASGLGGPADVTLTPPGDGPRDLYVRSVDRAGRESETTVHHFYVRGGNGPLAQWSFEGNAEDTAFLGDRDGTTNGGTTYTPGAVASGLTLDPAAQGRVSARTAVNTKASFSVSAWARIDDVTGSRAIVSQAGAQFPGFALWYRTDSELGGRRWVFGMPDRDSSPAGGAGAHSAEQAQPGVWTHLTGVYDAPTRTLRLYVNGVPSGTDVRGAAVQPWHATGQVQIGATRWDGNPNVDHFSGSIDEVALFDRALSEPEVRASVSRDNVQVGHWKFDDKPGTTAVNSVEGGTAGVLSPGATYTSPGIVGGAVRLDGTGGAVTVPGAQLRTDRSFTVSTWAKLDRQLPDGGAAVVLGQDGTASAGYLLHYRPSPGSPDRGRWYFMTPVRDENDAVVDTVIGTAEAKVGVPTHLAAVYDSAAGRIRLYVDGQFSGESARTGGFHATGAFTIGRGRWNGQSASYWPGQIDDVRAYSRALSQQEIESLTSRTSVTVGQWKLDGNLLDSSSLGRNGAAAPGTDFGGGQTLTPNPGDLALSLNGTGSHATAPHAVDTRNSFSVAAWARLDRAGDWPAVVSQDGSRTSAFQLQATVADATAPGGRWALAMFGRDVDGGGTSSHVIGSPVQLGAWTHLVAVYDAPTRKVHLYVNGVHAATKDAAHAGTPTDPGGFDVPSAPLVLGAAQWTGSRRNFFPGAIDDVAVYSRTLFAEEIRVMAGRDLSLVHNWTFDEPGGTHVADSVGARNVTASGAVRVPGRSGNAVRLDGVDDAVTGTKVDLRTDASFTVSTWVRIGDVTCPDLSAGCKRVVLSVDGAQSSSLRLGHVYDDDLNQHGKWFFEMPESDAADAEVLRASVSAAAEDFTDWVHLVGVYDRAANTVWLYVDGERADDGTHVAAWQASGGVAVGRGKVAGQAAEYFPGAVDDVRFYTGVFDRDRVAALRASYPDDAAPAPVPTDPVAHWKFDETTGTAAADATGHGHAATATGATGWIGGRKNGAMRLDGTPGSAAQTDPARGPVLDTRADFSVAAWTYLTDLTTHNRTLVAQDANRVSAFYLQYRTAAQRWSVLVPSADQDNPPVTVLDSLEAAPASDWTHLAVTYDRESQQLRLYVNGVLSAARTGVVPIASTGPLTLGRAKWNGVHADWYRYCLDDVQVYDRTLSAGEVRAVHDDVYAAGTGSFTFDDQTGKDSSWRNNHATVTATGVTYTGGVGGKGRAAVFDGVTGGAATTWSGVSMRDSFTVSAWVNLHRKDKVATVLAQNGGSRSAFVLQYRPGLDRWVFGAPTQDADGAPLLHATSLTPPVAGKWTHLTGVYDYAARQLRLSVDGELVGARDNVALWAGERAFTIGRGTVNGAPADHFPGAIDGVTVHVGARPAADIALMGWPKQPGGTLGRFLNSEGDHYTGATGAPVRMGYHFEGTLGALVPTQRAETRKVYACADGPDGFTSTDPACEGRTLLNEIGYLYTRQPTNVLTLPVYACRAGADRFESGNADCEGTTVAGLLGYAVGYANLGRYHGDDGHWSGVDGGPFGSRYEGPQGYLPLRGQSGTVALSTCLDGTDQFLSTDRTCGGKTVVGTVGEIWTSAPAGQQSKPLYSCRIAGQRYVDFSATCNGNAVDGLLGHVLNGPPDPEPVFS